jgi:hypothetical protein
VTGTLLRAIRDSIFKVVDDDALTLADLFIAKKGIHDMSPEQVVQQFSEIIRKPARKATYGTPDEMAARLVKVVADMRHLPDAKGNVLVPDVLPDGSPNPLWDTLMNQAALIKRGDLHGKCCNASCVAVLGDAMLCAYVCNQFLCMNLMFGYACLLCVLIVYLRVC